MLEWFIFGVICGGWLVYAATRPSQEPKLWAERLKELEALEGDRQELLKKLGALPAKTPALVVNKWPDNSNNSSDSN